MGRLTRGLSGGLMLALLPMSLLLVSFQASADVMVQQRLAILERQVGQLGQMSLDLAAVRSENRKLRGQIQDLQHQIDNLQRKQRDMYLDIDQRLSGSSAGRTGAQAASGSGSPLPMPSTVPATGLASPSSEPSAAAPAASPAASASAGPVNDAQAGADYKAAYALLSPQQRRYKEAAKAFSAFIQKYPGSRLAGNAQYWLAEAYYVSQDNAAAMQAFQTLLKKYPNSAKVPGSLYKIARLQIAAGDKAAASKTLHRLVTQYPDSPAAGLASRLVKSQQ